MTTTKTMKIRKNEGIAVFAERCAKEAAAIGGVVSMKYGTLCATCAPSSEYEAAEIHDRGCCYNCGAGY